MKKLLLISVGLFLISCGDSHDSIWNEKTIILEKIATILESVTDEVSAKKAIQDLEAIKKNLNDLSSRNNAMTPHNEAEKNKIANKYVQKSSAAVERMQNSASKVPLKVVQKLGELFTGENKWILSNP